MGHPVSSKKSDKRPGLKIANKKAYFDYEILEKLEAGIVLTGAEVKSIKSGKCQLKGSFITPVRGANGRTRLVTENLHISPYEHADRIDYDPMRRREVLLKRDEIDMLAGKTNKEGFTIIPLEIYLKKSLIKILLGVCRGKKAQDKRGVLKQRAISRDIDVSLKNFYR